MSQDDWTISAPLGQNLSRFTVSRPSGTDLPVDGARYLRLKPNGIDPRGQSAYFRIVTRVAQGKELWVAPSTFVGLSGSPVPVEIHKSSWIAYHLYRLVHDPSQRLTVFGSALAIVSLLVTDVLPQSPVITRLSLAGVGIAGVLVSLFGTLMNDG